MTPDNLAFFLSGMAGSAMCTGDVATILSIAAGYWRWGVCAICAVLFALNLVGTGVMNWNGTDTLSATRLALKVNVTAGVILLPIVAGIAWVCGQFWKHAGGLHPGESHMVVLIQSFHA
jgi:hypothetical protein